MTRWCTLTFISECTLRRLRRQSCLRLPRLRRRRLLQLSPVLVLRILRLCLFFHLPKSRMWTTKSKVMGVMVCKMVAEVAEWEEVEEVEELEVQAGVIWQSCPRRSLSWAFWAVCSSWEASASLWCGHVQLHKAAVKQPATSGTALCQLHKRLVECIAYLNKERCRLLSLGKLVPNVVRRELFVECVSVERVSVR